MSVSGGFGICDNDPWEVGGCDVVTVVRNVGTTVSPIVVLPNVVLKRHGQLYISKGLMTKEESQCFGSTIYLVVIVGSVVIVDSTTDFSMDEE